jgi:hypothetical protein
VRRGARAPRPSHIAQSCAAARARLGAARAAAVRPPPPIIAPAAPAHRSRSPGPASVAAANTAASWPGPSTARGSTADGRRRCCRPRPTPADRPTAARRARRAGACRWRRCPMRSVFGGGAGGEAGRSEDAVALGRVHPTGLRACTPWTDTRFWTSLDHSRRVTASWRARTAVPRDPTPPHPPRGGRKVLQLTVSRDRPTRADLHVAVRRKRALDGLLHGGQRRAAARAHLMRKLWRREIVHCEYASRSPHVCLSALGIGGHDGMPLGRGEL